MGAWRATPWVYQRRGGPLLVWKNGPPMPSRAADSVAMGCLAEPTLEMPLPRPGAPEPLGCADCNGAMGGFAISGAAKAVGLGLAALLAYRLFVKKRR